jgi:L-ascorbate metabolism protein UlaG (beta-lactamase superfamily)
MNTIVVRIALVLASLLLAATAGLAQDNKSAGATTGTAGTSAVQPVVIRFWGQSCFTIAADGKTLLIDPYNPKRVGYSAFDAAPQVVLITHEHFDHNDTSWVAGDPLVLHGLDRAGAVQPIDRTVGPFHIRSVAARHWRDPAQKARGNVAIFVIEVAGLKIVHLSDLGDRLSDQQIQAIGRPDVVMVPVGGFFTIDADQAYEVIQQLKPKACVIPMHYRTPALVESLRSRLAEPNAFVRKFADHVLRLDGNELEVNAAALPETMNVVWMDYRPASAGTQPSASQPAGQNVLK